MVCSSALIALSVGALAMNVVASPVVIRDSYTTLPLARHLHTTGIKNIVARDQARAKVLQARSQVGNRLQKGPVSVPIPDGVDGYTVDVQVGSPPTTYSLIVDTGSSNTWVGAGKGYTPTSSSVDTGNSVFVMYGSGEFVGEEYFDSVSIGHVAIRKQSIGAAKFAFGFNGVDGILGLGPTDLTNGTAGNGTIPTFLDNAVKQGLIKQSTIGISFEPSTGNGTATNGEITFGGTDSKKFTGKLNFVPLTSTSPASEYVGIDQSITYGKKGKTVLKSTAGVIDTGTTLILIASDAFSTYKQITGGVEDESSGLLKITKEQYQNLQSLFFHIGENTYELTANAQIWPRALNTAVGGEDGDIYLIVGDAGQVSGSGLDFINGFAFLQRFYHAIDYEGGRAGFATTSFTHAQTN